MTSTEIPSRARIALAPDPIAFQLYDDDNAPALCVDDGRVQRELHLELHNQSGGDIEFDPPLNATASPENHHLELRFRPGILSQRALGVLTAPNLASRVLPRDAQSWDVAAVRGENGAPVSVFMLFRGSQRTLPNDSRITLSLQELSAEAGLGSRPTQVQLKVRALRFANTRTPIISTVHRHLNVLNWGRAEAPLRAGFVGTSTLVNDGSQDNTLVLRLLNTSATETIGAAGPHMRPSLALSFDVGDANMWWTLDSKIVGAASVKVAWPPNDISLDVHQETPDAPVPRWKLDLPATGLGPGQHVDVTISGLRATGSGPTNLSLEYRDIPGYRQGRLVCQMQRAPLNDEMLAKLYKTVFQTHDSDIKAHATQLSTMGDRITAVASSHETLSADWQKWSGAKDALGVPKLVRDVAALKTEAHWLEKPIDFSRTGCAYAAVGGEKAPPWFAVVTFAGEDQAAWLRFKLGGVLSIPSLNRALNVVEKGGAILPIPQQLTPFRYTLTGLIGHPQSAPIPVTCALGNAYHGPLDAVTLFITGYAGPPPSGIPDLGWTLGLNQFNDHTYV